MSCATVPLEIGVPQQPHHSSPSKRSLMRPKSVARASTPTGFPKASPIVFAYLSSLPDFREDWTWNWCPASSVVPRMIRQEWYPVSEVISWIRTHWCFGWTRKGRNTPNQGHSKLESIKDMPVWIGSKALPLLKPSMWPNWRNDCAKCNSFLPACPSWQLFLCD